MFYNIRELYITFEKEKNINTFITNNKEIESIKEIFDKKLIPETHPYYEFFDVYNYSIIFFTDKSSEKYNDIIEVTIKKKKINCLCFYKNNKIYSDY